MNLTELRAAIETYTENNFPTISLGDGSTVSSTQQIDRFIAQAEQRVFNTIQFPSLRRNVTGSCTATNKYLQCPLDFLAAYSMAIIEPSGAYSYMLNKDVNFIREAYPSPSSVGLPKYYALFGTRSDLEKELTFILGPTPDASYSVELHYFYYPESITTAGTTWLGENFDSVLLYGSLVEAITFMKGEPDMVALYDGKYKEALMLAKRLGDGLERSDAYRSGQYREAPLPQNSGVR
jgi:hypothetical protein